jgi:hypothetical protein
MASNIYDVVSLVYERLCDKSIGIFNGIDSLIEDGEIDEDFFTANESEIYLQIDSIMFDCECCNWTCDMGDKSDKTDDLICKYCE